ncbi:hypothetical protein [Paraglaciecola sp. 20A4]|uniref:hypothetical protein n=1 Tax=Paraglaciecola sp. 20A4 TaxID=2687288 RepID=UPI00140729C9|nr:hypothetical protein [Paraglaciecola sp. 20A4]
MSHKITLMLLFISCSFIIGSAKDANASLLTDADGLNVGLFAEGSTNNLFGPIGTGVDANNLATGYIPNVTFGPTLPAGIPDNTQMEVSFFDEFVTIRQFLTSSGNDPSGLFSITDGWNMIIEDIEWPDGSEIIGATISDNTFLSAFTVDFTATSVSLLYAGNEQIFTDDELVTTLNLEVARPSVNASAPAVGLLIILSGFACAFLRRENGTH